MDAWKKQALHTASKRPMFVLAVNDLKIATLVVLHTKLLRIGLQIITKEKPGDGTLSNVLAWAGGRCAECSVSCEVAVKTVNGRPEETRVSFYKPDPTIPTLHINIDSIL